jgi:hypothetical protein
LAGVAYGSRSEPGTEVHAEALKEIKPDAYSKPASKCMKVPAGKKPGPLRIVVPKAKISVKRPLHTEIALVKPVERMRKVALGSLAAPAARVS